MAQLITAEMGAPITFSKLAQAALPCAMLGALADVAAAHRWEEVRPGHYGQDVRLRKEAVGVVAAIVPWNMPQFSIVVKLAPALLAGSAVVLKPAPETPLDALLLAEMIDELGLPPGVVSVLPGDRETGAHLVGHPGVDKVAFTGSTAAGRQVAAACAANLTRVSLELGGKSAAVVLDDADGIDRGWYVRPTLFADAENGMRIAREEIFGPVLTVIPYGDEGDAVRIANDSDYGLSGSVWTGDVDRGLAVARRVRTGTFGVNQPYSMDPAAPFGGVKASGFGRELGTEGLDEFLDIKAISVAPAP